MDSEEVSPQALSWTIFQSRLKADWKQGEHASIIGATGEGKSHLKAKGLLPMWAHSLTLDIKGDDPELLGIPAKVITAYPKPIAEGFLFRGTPFERPRFDHEKFRMVDPSHDMKKASKAFGHCLEQAFRDGGWLIDVDELRAITDPRYMGLGPAMEKLWLFGRSKGITVLAATQAPRWVPTAFYEQARHHFIFRTTKKAVLKRLEEIDTNLGNIQEIVQRLDPFHFLYVGPRFAAISKMEV